MCAVALARVESSGPKHSSSALGGRQILNSGLMILILVRNKLSILFWDGIILKSCGCYGSRPDSMYRYL